MIFKTLLKKELMSFASGFVKKKNKTMSPTGAIIGFCIVLFLLLGFLGIAFFSIFYELAPRLIEKGEQGLYFTLAAIGAFGLSIFGSVAAVKNKLYEAKDNDALLSMPIPPKYILICRIIPVFLECFLFQLTFFVPALIAYYSFTKVTVSLLLQILLIPAFSLMTTAITCLIGRLLAFIMSKVKHKNLITMILFLLFFVGYYLLMMSSNDFIVLIMDNVDSIKHVFEGILFAFYQVGLALSGKALSFIIVLAVCLGFFALVFYRLSKTYIKTVTHTGKINGIGKIKENYSQNSVLKSLLYKEWKRFLSSPLYMMNSGMGCIFAVFAGCAMLFTNNLTAELVGENPPAELTALFPFFVLIFMSSLSGMNTVSAPSISLEGKNLWILKSLPIDSSKIIQAKLLLHVLVSAPFSLFAGVAMSIGFEINFFYALASIVCGLLLIPIQGFIGLLLGIKRPNLNWNTEAEPIKQSFAVFLSMLLNILISFVMLGIGIFSAFYLHPIVAFAILIAISATVNFLCFKWTKHRGAILFNNILL